MTLEEVKEQCAKDHGWRSYNDAVDNANVGVISGYSFADIWEDVAQRYAQSQTQELIEQNREIVAAIKELTPMAEDGYKLHCKNGSHQDFLEDDREILKKAKELLTKYNHLNKKP